MDASFVDGLKRKDGKAHECETCHVDMEMQFLSHLGAVTGAQLAECSVRSVTSPGTSLFPVC